MGRCHLLSTNASIAAGAGRPAWLVPLASLAGFLLIWQATALFVGQPRILPSLLAVTLRLGEEAASGELLFHLGMTLWRVACAFTIAMTVGIAVGVLMGRVRLADEIGQPWLLFFLNLPALVLIVLAYIWIGLNEVAAIAAVALNKIPNVAVTVREGARAIDKGLLEMARVFQLPSRRVLREIVLPQLYPFIMAAARAGLALIWKIVLVVELLGRSNGVGFQIGLYFQLFDVASIMAYALAFIVIVQLLEWFVLQPLERMVNQWRR